jgi:hypothetical protein
MPDQPSPRRRFQFRLRTLMIGVTIAALLCPVGARIVLEWQAMLQSQREADDWREYVTRNYGSVATADPAVRPAIIWLLHHPRKLKQGQEPWPTPISATQP